MAFIRRSLQPLFGDWKYLLFLYVSGSVVLGTIGYDLQRRGMPTALSIWLLVVLVVPFHFLTYRTWERLGAVLTKPDAKEAPGTSDLGGGTTSGETRAGRRAV
jgi:hypothetical protein